MKNLCITHVLNLATNVDNFFPSDLIYKRIEILDLPSSDIRIHFDDCFAFINEALSNGKKVLVHCNAGVSRSAAIVVGYLMVTEKLSLLDAMSKVREQRSCIRPNEGFMKQLNELEKELQLKKCQL